jgi:hypothetical protein
MYESTSFIYLDLEKTGTNFIVDFRERFKGEGRRERTAAEAPARNADDKKLRFISVRDPLEQYISLYSFGCGGKGALSHRMKKKGRGGLYEGTSGSFRKWLQSFS